MQVLFGDYCLAECTFEVVNSEAVHRENMLRFDAVEKEYLNAREDRLRQKGFLIDSPTE